jgi:hypothetical protein
VRTPHPRRSQSLTAPPPHTNLRTHERTLTHALPALNGRGTRLHARIRMAARTQPYQPKRCQFQWQRGSARNRNAWGRGRTLRNRNTSRAGRSSDKSQSFGCREKKREIATLRISKTPAPCPDRAPASLGPLRTQQPFGAPLPPPLLFPTHLRFRLSRAARPSRPPASAAEPLSPIWLLLRHGAGIRAEEGGGKGVWAQRKWSERGDGGGRRGGGGGDGRGESQKIAGKGQKGQKLSLTAWKRQ